MSRLIDADELIKAIQTDIMGGLNYEHFIRIAPTVDAVPVVHGHWNDATKQIGYPKWSCSICGKEGRGDYSYCCWCGAKMDEVTE